MGSPHLTYYLIKNNMFEDRKYFLLIAEAFGKGLGVSDREHVIGEDDFHISLIEELPTIRIYHLITSTFALELTAEIYINGSWEDEGKQSGDWEKGFKVKEITKKYHGTRKVGLGDSLKWIDDRSLNFL